MSQEVWKVHGDIHLLPWEKEGRDCADFHEIYAYSTILLKKTLISDRKSSASRSHRLRETNIPPNTPRLRRWSNLLHIHYRLFFFFFFFLFFFFLFFFFLFFLFSFFFLFFFFLFSFFFFFFFFFFLFLLFLFSFFLFLFFFFLFFFLFLFFFFFFFTKPYRCPLNPVLVTV